MGLRGKELVGVLFEMKSYLIEASYLSLKDFISLRVDCKSVTHSNQVIKL